MPHASLADFIEALEQSGELARIAAQVDADLELSAIADRAAGSRSALFFEQVAGHRPPVVANLLDSDARICRALAVASVCELAERLADAAPLGAEGWLDRFKSRQPADPLARFAPKMVKSGVCQQVVLLGRDVDLSHWPLPRFWPEERQPTITAACLVSQDPHAAMASIESPPLVMLDRNKLGIVWHRYQRTHTLFEQFRAAGRRMPVAAWLGGPPGLSLVAAAPLPANVDAWQFAGLLVGQPVELVKCRSLELAAPATAEIVMEGYVDPAETPIEIGPLAQPSGYYADAWAQPLAIETISHRNNPIFPCSVPRAPVSEWSALADVAYRLWLPVAKRLAPELVDYAPASHTGLGEIMVVSIRKQHPRQAQKVAAALWGSDWLMLAKAIVVVDADIDVRNGGQVLRAIGVHVDPGCDLFFHDGPMHPFDQAASTLGVSTSRGGRAIGIDATAKLPEERAGTSPRRMLFSGELTDVMDAY